MSCRESLAKPLQGELCGEAEGRATATVGKEYQEEKLQRRTAQGHPTQGGVNPEEGGSSRSRDFASGGSGNKEQQSWVGHGLFFFLYYSNPTPCKPRDSLAVLALLLQRLAATSTPVPEQSFLCHLLAGNLPAASLWLPRDGLLRV